LEIITKTPVTTQEPEEMSNMRLNIPVIPVIIAYHWLNIPVTAASSL